MKALSLDQPHASLVAMLVKNPETRSWATKYRGPLAIASTKKRPAYQRIGPYLVEPFYDEVRHVIDCECEPDGVAPRCARRSKSHMVLTLNEVVVSHLPLGAVLATSELVDVVPITENPTESEKFITWHRSIETTHGESVPWMFVQTFFWERDRGSAHLAVTIEQLPYGDFTPGRYAWLLAGGAPTSERCPACWGTSDEEFFEVFCYKCGASFDQAERSCLDCGCSMVKLGRCPTCAGTGQCEPVPAKGRQGLWEWTP